METSTFSYTAKDFSALAKVTDRYFRPKWSIAVTVISLLCAVIFICAAINLINILDGFSGMLIWPIVLPIVFIYNAFFRYIGRGAITLRAYNRNNNDTNCSYVFLNEEVHSKNIQMNTETPYIQIIGFGETKEAFFLFLNKTSAYIVPKRALDNPDKLREFLRARLTCEYKKFNF